jgi:hypothetical protein
VKGAQLRNDGSWDLLLGRSVIVEVDA